MYDPDNLTNRNEATVRRLLQLVESFFKPYHRSTVRGLERIPAGPALFVGNHNGATLSIDTFLLGAAIINERGMDDLPFGLAHDLPMRLPVFNQLLSEVGAVRACPENADRLFADGRKVMVYPGGDVDAMRPYRARDEVRFGGRCGFARLAIRSQVPIVPVVAHGAHSTLIIFDDMRWLAKAVGVDRALRMKALPLSFSLPWGLMVGPPLPYFPLPAKVTVEVLDPIPPPVGGVSVADDPVAVAEFAEDVRLVLQRRLTEMASEAKQARRH